MRVLLIALLAAISYAQTDCVPCSNGDSGCLFPFPQTTQSWCDGVCTALVNSNICPKSHCICRTITTTTTTTTTTTSTAEPTGLPSLNPTVNPTLKPSTFPSKVPTESPKISSETPEDTTSNEPAETHVINFSGDYLNIIRTYKSLFLQECTVQLGVTCTNVESGNSGVIVLTITGSDENVPNCLKLPSFTEICQEAGGRTNDDDQSDEDQASIWVLIAIIGLVICGLCFFFWYAGACSRKRSSSIQESSIVDSSFMKATPYPSDHKPIPSTLKSTSIYSQSSVISDFNFSNEGAPHGWSGLRPSEGNISEISTAISTGDHPTKHSSEGRTYTQPIEIGEKEDSIDLYRNPSNDVELNSSSIKRSPEDGFMPSTGGDQIEMDTLDSNDNRYIV